MRTVWKYNLDALSTEDRDVDACVTAMMPAEAEILTVQFQGSFLVVWALVDPHAPLSERRLRVVITGGLVVDDPVVYIGTAQNSTGLVFHVFEENPK